MGQGQRAPAAGLLGADEHVVPPAFPPKDLGVPEMGGVAVGLFQHRAQFQIASAVLGDGQALAAVPQALVLDVAGVVEAEFAVDFQGAAGINAVLVVGLVGYQGAALELPVDQVVGCKAAPFFIGVVLFKLVPLEVHMVDAAVPGQTVGVVQKAGRGLQMKPLAECFSHGDWFLLQMQCLSSVLLI